METGKWKMEKRRGKTAPEMADAARETGESRWRPWGIPD
jgi:hypothetical protein